MVEFEGSEKPKVRFWKVSLSKPSTTACSWQNSPRAEAVPSAGALSDGTGGRHMTRPIARAMTHPARPFRIPMPPFPI